ncbi:hypothetical protein [Paracandidimonas soli]|uniref:hypothetical protein n=1 Tax=Paracandidimonas soli TaxID=1917182 RepID=UPI0033414646
MKKRIACSGATLSETAAHLLFAACVLSAVAPPANALASARLLDGGFGRMEKTEGFRWSATETQRISHMRLHTRRFLSDRALPDSARRLSQSGTFTRMLLAPAMIQLSGIDANWHWVAHLETAESGTAGYVSALEISPSAIPRKVDRRDASGFSLTDANALLDHVSWPGGIGIAQQVLHVGTSHAHMLAYLQRRLRGEGWVTDALLSSAADGYSSWQRHGERLVLLPDALGEGSLLYHSRLAVASEGE